MPLLAAQHGQPVVLVSHATSPHCGGGHWHITCKVVGVEDTVGRETVEEAAARGRESRTKLPRTAWQTVA